MESHVDREYTEFLRRVRDRARRSSRVVERNRWVEPITVTQRNAYDAEIEKLTEILRGVRAAA